MPTYRVYPKCVISTSVVVDAENKDEAIEKALDVLDHTWPDQGDWDAETSDVEEV